MTIATGSGGASAASAIKDGPPRKTIKHVEDYYPKIPQPFKMKDWKKVARDFDALVFDAEAAGEYLPIARWDYTGTNGVEKTIALPAYVGEWETRLTVGSQEALAVLPAVVGGSLAGIDKSDQDGENYVKMTQAFYQKYKNFMIDHKTGDPGGTFWYDLTPAIMFAQLTDLYPDVDGMREIFLSLADFWREAAYAFGPSPDMLDFEYATSYSPATRKPSYNGSHCEIDGGAGIALVCYYAYMLSGEAKYLDAALDCMRYYENSDLNPLYESLGLWAGLVGSRLNAEQGTDYHTEKFFKYFFEGDSDDRWGFIGSSNYSIGEYGAQGIYTCYYNGGYAFCMDTFAAACSIVPAVKYDARYARSIGKYMLNCANNARMFYPDEWDAAHQSCPDWDGDPDACIPYEGLRTAWNGVSPYASGDPTVADPKWADTDFGIYSGNMVGYLAAMIDPTDDERIPRIDLNACDFFADADFPCYLYYNPYDVEKTVSLPLAGTYDVYEAVSNAYIRKGASGVVALSIPADDAIVVKLLPPGSAPLTLPDGRILLDGKYVAALKPAVNITNIRHKEMLEGTAQVALELFLPEGDALKAARIECAGVELYAGGALPALFALDTTLLPDGFQTLSVAVETNRGLSEVCELRVLVSNKPGNVILDYTGAELLDVSLPAGRVALTLKEEGETLRMEAPNPGIAGISIPGVAMDFSRPIALYLETPYMQYGMYAQLKLDDGQYGENIGIYSGDSPSWSSHVNYDLYRHQHGRRDLSGMRTAGILLYTHCDAFGSAAEISRLRIFYQDEIPDPPARGASSLNYRSDYGGYGSSGGEAEAPGGQDAPESTGGDAAEDSGLPAAAFIGGGLAAAAAAAIAVAAGLKRRAGKGSIG